MAGFGDGDSIFGFVGSGFFGDADCFLAAGEVFAETFRRLLETGWTSEPSLSSASALFSRFTPFVGSVSLREAVGVGSVASSTLTPLVLSFVSASLLAACLVPPKANVVCFFGGWLAPEPKNLLQNEWNELAE